MNARIRYLLYTLAATICVSVVMLVAELPNAMADSKDHKSDSPSPASKCDCNHIKAMEQIIGDYKWLADAHALKATKLEAQENPLFRSRGSAARASDEMTALWDDYNKWEETTVRTDFERARNYSATAVVKFDESTNKPDPKQLEKARKESACLRIADSYSRHEQKHTNVREDGRGRFDRPSKLALEEKDHYEDGMKFIQDEVDALKNKPKCRQPRTDAYGGNPGEAYAQRDRVRRAINRVSSYAATI